MFILAHYSIKPPTNTIIPDLIYGFGAAADRLAFFSFKSALSIDTSYVFKTYINGNDPNNPQWICKYNPDETRWEIYINNVLDTVSSPTTTR